MRKIKYIVGLIAIIFIAACGSGDNSSITGNNKQMPNNQPINIKTIAFIGDISKYPEELRDSIGNIQVAWDGDKNVDAILMRVDIFGAELDAAYEANKKGIPLIIYGNKQIPSQSFLNKFITSSGGYVTVKIGGPSLYSLVYDESQLGKLAKEIAVGFRAEKSAIVNAAIMKAGRQREEAQIEESTVNGQKLRTWTNYYVYKKAESRGKDDYANITIKVIGMRNISADTAKNKTFWTISAQGLGFSGNPLYSKEYTPIPPNNSRWFFEIPKSYGISLTLEKGTSDELPIISTYSPSNQQVSGTITASTGWSINAGGTVAADPSINVNGSYSSTESRSYNVTDAKLLTNIKSDSSANMVDWTTTYVRFKENEFSKDGAGAFLSAWISAYDSNVRLNNFEDISPTMQAFSPMFNILYQTSDIDSTKNHEIKVGIKAQKWKFKIEREVFAWVANQSSQTSQNIESSDKITINNYF